MKLKDQLCTALREHGEPERGRLRHEADRGAGVPGVVLSGVFAENYSVDPGTAGAQRCADEGDLP